MAYEPKTWVCGETITADGLNHLEQGLADCCGSGGDCGYSCSEETVSKVYFDGNVTTVQEEYDTHASFPLSTPIEDGDYLSIILNGTEYELPKNYYYADDDYSYGDENFITSPCFIMCDGDVDEGYLFTPSEGTYSLKVQRETTVDVIETSECFEKAVKKAAPSGYECSIVKTQVYDKSFTSELSGGVYGYTDGNADTQAFTKELYVIFDGVEYACNKTQSTWGAPRGSGGFDWSEFPFSLFSYHGLVISTKDGGAHTIVISTGKTVAEFDDCFKVASQQSNRLVANLYGQSATGPYYLDKSFDEMRAAIDEGKEVIVFDSELYFRLVIDHGTLLKFANMYGLFNGANSKFFYVEILAYTDGTVEVKRMDISGSEA